MIDINQNILERRVETLDLLIGDDALSLIYDDWFIAEWDSLYERCPWATVFQKREFVTSWYTVYLEKHIPIIVLAKDNGKLTGLLTLAKTNEKYITGAGGNQAEYQVWLAEEVNSSVFIKKTLELLRKHFPKATIQLNYIPYATPISWIKTDAYWSRQCKIQSFKQPLLIVDEDSITKELRKKNKREKINRLKRLGELKFERITEVGEFTSIIDELAIQFDFRKGATVNISPFKDDKLKKKFILALFDQNVIHATILKLNDEIIASNIGATGKNWIHLQGLNTHSPFYAKHSPGILHFLMLGKQMVDENLEVFDLTPGENSYKDGLANHYIQAFSLTFSSPRHILIQKIQYILTNYIKALMLKAGAKKTAFKDFKKTAWIVSKKVRQNLNPTIIDRVNFIKLTNKDIIYSADLYSIKALNTAIQVNSMSLEDLLNYNDQGEWLTRWEFLEDAMKRFEGGQRCYTWAKDGLLLACAWLGPWTINVVTPKEADLILQGLYGHRESIGHLASFLASVAVKSSDDRVVYAMTKERHISRALEEAGFKSTLF
ncbi:GNAT family N-acetyltransferase [uncultured Pontibacter sp.]|uniref:GNAT family N-acetyltransferase n=1 Tax=uncultured Pontibacter sp. TaxID=453356 RepID=UPI002628D2B2|nr:GNAT family N-acetyltransferase [uncultured Pontibacter sp.]